MQLVQRLELEPTEPSCKDSYGRDDIRVSFPKQASLARYDFKLDPNV